MSYLSKYKILLIFLCLLNWNSSVYSQPIIWEPLSGPFGGHTNAIAAGPGGQLYAGGGLMHIYRSTDYGITWFDAHQANSDIMEITVLANGDVLPGGFNGQVYRSTNAGQEWQNMNSTVIGSSLRALLALPNGQILAGSYNGVFRSTNGGESWEGTGLQDDILGLTSAPNGDIYAGSTHGVNDQAGVFRSTDNGQTWQLTTALRPVMPGSIYTVFAMVADTDGNIYAGTDDYGLYSSNNHGTTWTQTGLNTGSVWSLGIDQAGRLLAGLDGSGVIYSVDQGQTWMDTNISAISVRGGFARYNSDTFSFVSTHDGIFSTPGNTPQTWHKIGLPLGTTGLYAQGDVLYSLTRAEGELWHIDRTIDAGHTWESLATMASHLSAYSIAGQTNGDFYIGFSSALPFPPYDDEAGVLVNQVGGFSMYPVGFPVDADRVPTIFVTTNQEVFAGTDNGLFRLNGVQEPVAAGLSGSVIFDMAQTAEGDLWAGTNNGVYRSTDNGQSWSQIGLSNIDVVSLTTDLEDGIYAATANGVQYLPDNGVWQSINSGLDDLNVHDILATPNGLYAATRGGVYVSPIEDISWSLTGDNFAVPDITKLVGLSSNNVIAGSVFGLYKHLETPNTIEDDSQQQSMSGFWLAQNYPNPVKTATNFSYHLSRPGHVSLTIYNIAGQRLQTLVNGQQDAGTHHVAWQNRDQVNGVYLYRLSVDGYSQTRRFICLKQ